MAYFLACLNTEFFPFFGPLAMIIAQVAMGHITIIDVNDLFFLTLQGLLSAKQRVQALLSCD